MDVTEIISSLKLGNFSAENVLRVVIIFVVCCLAMRLILVILRKTLKKSSLDETLVQVTYTGVKILLYVLTALIIIDSLGVPITSLVAVFSVVGLAFSLAIQSFLTNCAGGLQLLVTKPFAVGDYIELGSESGKVHSIGFVYTRLHTNDNKIVYVPNSEISAGKITNYTAQPNRRVDLLITASYDDKPDYVKDAVYACIHRLPMFLNDPEPFVGIDAFQESRIAYVVRAWVDTADYWDGYYALQEEIYAEFEQRGIDMAYDRVDVKIIGADDVK